MELRDYQEKLISDIRSEFVKGHKRVLAVSPCGSGKTATTAAMIGRAASREHKCLFTVHRQELLDQSIAAFREQGIDHGCIAAGYDSDPSKQVQIASIETLRRRLHNISFDPTLIVIDEAQHSCSSSWCSVIEHFSKARSVGITATPERLDGKGLGSIYNSMVLGPDVRFLIDGNFLCDFDIYGPTNPSMESVGKRYGDYVQDEAENVMDVPTITGDAIREYKKHCDGKRAIAFCVSQIHSRHVADAFTRSGIPALHIDSGTSKNMRREAIRKFRLGEIKVLTSVDIFSEGFDVPAVEAVILLRPTQSLALYLQQIGRALRYSIGKIRAVVLDHAGNVLRHGWPDDRREWNLIGAKQRRKTEEERDITIKTCKKCYYMHRTATSCPKCGYIYPVVARKIEEVAGDLVKMEREFNRRRNNMEIGMTKDREGLERLAIDRGYSNPTVWAEIRLAAREKRKPDFKEAMMRRALYNS